jgi:hypothetical protein
MSKTTGNRSTTFDQIDALDEAQTVAELVALIQPILYELTYHAVNSESATLDSHEEWHAGGMDMLYGGMNTEHQAAQEKAARPRKRPSKKPVASAPAPPSNRPRAEYVSPALRAIMEGTHPTLVDDELPEGRWVRPT